MKTIELTFVITLENGAPDARVARFNPTDETRDIQGVKFRLYLTPNGGKKYIPADDKVYKLWLAGTGAVELG